MLNGQGDCKSESLIRGGRLKQPDETMPRDTVQDEELAFEESEDQDEDELCEASYTSDFDDDDPSAFVCDLPEDEAAAYKQKNA